MYAQQIPVNDNKNVAVLIAAYLTAWNKAWMVLQTAAQIQ